MKKGFSVFRISKHRLFYFFLFPAILAVLTWQKSALSADSLSQQPVAARPNHSRHLPSGNYSDPSFKQNNELADAPVFSEFNDWLARHLSNNSWYLLRSAQGFTAVQFGASSDKPVANAFVP